MRVTRAAALAAAACLLLACVLPTAAQGASGPPAAGGGASGGGGGADAASQVLRGSLGSLGGAEPQTAPSPAPTTLASRSAASLQGVLISELMSSNKATLKDEDGTFADWLELHNAGTTAASLAGYKLVDERGGGDSWAIPSGVSLAPGQYLLVFASGKDRASASAPLHTSFKLSASDGYLALLAPDGSTVSEVSFPELPADVSFGIIEGATTVLASGAGPVRYAVLATPTPGKPNSGPRPGGPLITNPTRTAASAGGDIPVTAIVTQQQSPLAGVELVYTVGYGPETALPMTATGDQYSATIPASAAPAGALVRWFVRATDSQGGVTRDPPFTDPSDRQYWGTIVPDSTDKSSLPVLELYCQDEKAPFSKDDVPGCSLTFNGSFYDNIFIRRRGVTSLNWPKPKIKIDSTQGSMFAIRPGMTVNEFNLNSQWQEPGENTFMREPLVWEVFNEMGVTSLVSFHLHMRMNGKYFGKYAFVEQMDEDSLKRWGYDVEPVGPLWKSTSGEYSNLRWDVKPEHLPYYWKQYTRKKDNSTEGQELLAFARGISGGAPGVPRSKYLFDAVNLPQVINHMAAQTLILNQDRCTKNFYIYRDPASGQWSMMPYDVESGFGIDRGLGGKPAPDYCILACEQWNSPLYCDKNHPQDLAVKTPWGLITAQYDLFTTGRRLQSSTSNSACAKVASTSGDPLAQAARKLLQEATAGTAGTAPAATVVQASGAAAPGLSLPPNSSIPLDYDADLTTKGPTPTGAPGTYNYLIDAILSVPRTRQMYARRLRTLMDAFIQTGRLQSIVTSMYNEIKVEAQRDAAQWSNPGSPERGYQQLMTEQLPIRKQQLYETYGPGGPIPLIPDAQPTAFQLSLGRLEPGASGFVEVINPNAYAVDISEYRLQGAVQLNFPPGTIIPAQDSVFGAVNLSAFRQRTTPPARGDGSFVVGPLAGQLLGAAASVQLVKPDGTVVVST